MACSCQKNRKQWEVVAEGGKGKVLYTGTEATSKAVARRYEGSIAREKEKAAQP
ncbi:hypothetical protein ACFVW5_17930 [Streptomyces sp. NPDC058232]|uniref:hypothetical protein n=1 Tax=Streptomyces sp. NPDC058232 TaxID=3346393 RepID=UPI0036E4F130